MTVKKPFIEITPAGRDFIEVEEGSVPYAYDDAVFPTRPAKIGEKIKGTLTIGVGHVGADVFPGQKATKAQIDKWLDDDLDTAERAVSELVKVKLTPRQRDTLISFTFNAGVTAFGKSTLLRKLNAGDYDSVPFELRKWTKTTIGGRKVTSKGLIKRRADEVSYWLGGGVLAPSAPAVSKGSQIPEVTPIKTSPLEYIAGAGTMLGGAAGFANSTGFINIAIGAAVVIAAVVFAAIIIKRQFFAT